MGDGATIAGHVLTGRTRISELGTWHDAASPQEVPSGVLRFDPRAVATPEARERLVAAVSAENRLRQGGPTPLLPVADLVTARGEVWLITSRRAMPSLADLLAEQGGGLDAGSAATILVETAQALLAVHAAGLTHGALHPGTVIVADDGSALLAERGLLEALRGEPVSAERDVAAWSALARGLAASWAHGDAATLMERAASTASTHGLGPARDTLLAGRDALPPGFTTRERLADAVRRWSSGPAATVPVPPAPTGAGEAVTLLDVPGGTASGAVAYDAARTSAPGQGGDVMMRFGPGVPPETTAAQIWRSGQGATAHTTVGQTGGPAPKARGRRKTAWAGTVLLAMLIALVILWLRQSPAADIAVSKVDVKAPKKVVRCDGTAEFVGVVTTNGEAGTISYMWIQSDAKKPLKPVQQRVASGTTSVNLPLHWKVTGPSSFRGTATLRVMSPTPSGKPLQDKASFNYKC
ncbi:hypothetical protein [Microbispora sp. NPDC049125]|uniref:hypothetical protein n=1 Tax=Microbispora sp. NPDC049125 TaxID=3154929 RepID=UPI003466974E